MKLSRLAILPALFTPLLALLPATANAQIIGATAARWGTLGGPQANSTTTDIPVAVNVPDPGATVKEISTSNAAGYALMSDGTVWAWGMGSLGELGNGRRGNSIRSAVKVKFPASTFITSLPPDTMPYDSGLALDSRGRVWGWGANNDGQLCVGDTAVDATPVRLPLSGVTALAGAGDHALYLAGHTLYACGSGAGGMLGDGSTKSSLEPVEVRLPSREIPVTPVASWEDSGVLTESGAYYDWGYNTSGQLGDGTTEDSSLPVPVRLPGPVTQVSLGGSESWNGQTVAELTDGSWQAWGNDSWQQLGDRRTAAEPFPEPLVPPAGTAAVVSSGATLYALTRNGNVWAWGDGSLGQLGNGRMANSATPVLAETGVAMLEATANNVMTAS